MKNIYTFLVAIILTTTVFAQSPEKMSYQAVIRDVNSALVANQNIGIQISILQGTEDGITVYTETQNPTTNINGLVSLEIGTGSTTDNFSEINWSDGPFFVKTETDIDGEANYTIVGVSELLSVPYALHAKTAENSFSGNYDDLTNTPDLTAIVTTEEDPQFIGWDKSTGIAISESQINDLQTYLINEFDPVFSTWDKSTGIVITESQISDLQTYITEEVDGDISNEIQDLHLSGNILTITNNGTATTIDLGIYLDNTDTQLGDADIATMGYIKSAEDGDANSTNEIQNISRTGTTVTLSSGGGTYTDSVNTYTSGTGITISASNVISANDADDTNEIELPTSANTGDMNYWNGSAWVIIPATVNEGANLQMINGVPTWVGGTPPPPAAIGDYRDGGVVFYVDGTGQHGLVCAVSDQSLGIKWFNGTYIVTGATGDDIGTGQANTSAIVTIQGAGNYAAQVCNDLSSNGYDDWFLPSKEELKDMYQNKATINPIALANGGSGIATAYYWSSTEYSYNNASFWPLDIHFLKNNSHRVRAVRAF